MPVRDVTLNRNDYESLRRVYVTEARAWGVQLGTDYLANWNVFGTGTTLLTDGGWTVTTIDTATAGDASKLMSKATPGTPGAMTFDAAGEVIASPAIFGDYLNAHVAADLLNKHVLPRYLVCDTYAAFAVASTNEAIAGFGLTESGTTGVTSVDHLAAVVSDSVNWDLDLEGTVKASTIAVDNNNHWFRIILDAVSSIATLWVDGVLAVTGATPYAPEAAFPARYFVAMGTNQPNVFHTHIFYAWRSPFGGIQF